MLRDSFSELRRHPSRMAATLIAIAISIGFVAGASIFVTTERDATARALELPLSRADLAITAPMALDDPDALTRAAEATPGVVDVEPVMVAPSMSLTRGVQAQFFNMFGVPTDEFAWSRLSEGAWPARPDELALSRQGMDELGASLGDEVEANGDQRMRIVGVTDDARSLFVRTGYVSASMSSLMPEGRWMVRLAPGVDAEATAKALAAAVKPFDRDAEVVTAAESRQKALVSLTSEFDVFKIALQVFAAISVVVGLIVINTTFGILLAQRRRQIGLLRAVGATGAQVRGKFVAEAFWIGLIGSLLGLGVGFGLAAAGAAVTGSLFWGLSIPWLDLAQALVIGTLGTVIASIVPILRATRVPPLEALRPVPSQEEARRNSIAWLVVCAVMALAGAGFVVASQSPGELAMVWGVAGATCLTVAVLGSARTYVPFLLRGVGALVGRRSPTIRLAAENAGRNPARAASTSVALMLAMGLIVTLQVGAASFKQTSVEYIQRNYPIDVTVSSATGEPLPDSLEGRVAALPGLERVDAVQGVKGHLGFEEVWVLRGEDALARILPSDRPGPGAALVGASPMSGELRVGDVQVAVKARGVDYLGAGMVVVPDETFDKLPGERSSAVLWLTFDEQTNAAEAQNQLMGLIGTSGEFNVEGGILMAGVVSSLIDVVLAVLTCLLGVAVAVALVGVANTLSLSVLERRRENALLRALGLQRSGLRAMLLAEAMLLSLVGLSVGLAAGSFFGWLGITSAMNSSPVRPSVVSFSIDIWWTLALVALIGVAAAAASVLPGRRAAMATPTEALADE